MRVPPSSASGSWLAAAGTPHTVSETASSSATGLVGVVKRDPQPVVAGAHATTFALDIEFAATVNPNFATSPGFGARL